MSTYDYATIVTTGADATEFLQGQLTADLGKLDPGDRGLAAWCNPKGRVICVFRVTRTDAGFRLALPAEMAEGTLRRLTMFRFRSKVDFELAPATPEDLGTNDTIDRWRLDNLRNGIPEIGLDQTEKFTPHMLNLDLLDAISLDKGCYTGQEVVARTHYRGATKRRTLRFESETPVEAGAKVAASGRDVGEVLNVAGTDLLAVIPVDSAGEPLSVEGTELERVTMPYEP